MKYDVVLQEQTHRWLCFQSGEGVPLVILPAHSGKDWHSAEALIECCIETERPVYVFDLLSATQHTKDVSTEYLVSMIDQITDHLDVVDLIGYSQGGVLAAIFAAMHPEAVRKLAVFVAPIKMRNSPRNMLEVMMKVPYVAEGIQNLVNMDGGLRLGKWQEIAFKLATPNAKPSPYPSRNLAGVWFMDFLKNIFRDNRLYDGTFICGNSEVKLEDITAETHCFGAVADTVVSLEQSLGLADKVSGKSYRHVMQGDHYECWQEHPGLATFYQYFLEYRYDQD